jgi:hypothetical protein
VVPSAISCPSRGATMLTVWVRRTPHHAFYQGVLLGCFANFSFVFCSCLFIFCFRPFSLSFLPLSPIAYLLFPLSPARCLSVILLVKKLTTLLKSPGSIFPRTFATPKAFRVTPASSAMSFKVYLYSTFGLYGCFTILCPPASRKFVSNLLYQSISGPNRFPPPGKAYRYQFPFL